MNPDVAIPPRASRGPKVVSLKEERLDRKLALAFGFMSFIPILIVVWAMVSGANLGLALYAIVASAFIGYFVVARGMVQSVLTLAEQARAIASGRNPGTIDASDHNEIGELARAFNRITQDLEGKIDELESSRQLVKKLLSRIGTAIVSYEGIDNLLQLILENTVVALNGRLGTLMLVDGEKQDLTIKSTWSPNGETVDAAFRVKLGEGILGWVAREGRPMRSGGHPGVLGFQVNGAAEEGALLAVPLKLRDHPMGVIGVYRVGPGASFTEDDETLVTSIGSQIAVAIENYRLNLDVERTYVETIMALALAVEAKDPYSAGHSKRVGYYAKKTGEAMGLDAEACRLLESAGILHDIGKIGVKDEILLKRGALAPDEEKIMQQHPVIGEAIVKPVRSLQKAAMLVRHHHERYNGSGYPGGLKGDEIPLEARILTVVDTYDSMVTDRPYRKRLPVEVAEAELQRCAGHQFDPVVVEAFLRILAERTIRNMAAEAKSPVADDADNLPATPQAFDDDPRN